MKIRIIIGALMIAVPGVVLLVLAAYTVISREIQNPTPLRDWAGAFLTVGVVVAWFGVAAWLLNRRIR